jgi:hypothetical protein
MVLTRETRFTRNMSGPVPLFPPQIPNQLANAHQKHYELQFVYVCIVQNQRCLMASGMC